MIEARVREREEWGDWWLGWTKEVTDDNKE